MAHYAYFYKLCCTSQQLNVALFQSLYGTCTRNIYMVSSEGPLCSYALVLLEIQRCGDSTPAAYSLHFLSLGLCLRALII